MIKVISIVYPNTLGQRDAKTFSSCKFCQDDKISGAIELLQAATFSPMEIFKIITRISFWT